MEKNGIIFFERKFPSANMILIKDQLPILIDTGFGSDAKEYYRYSSILAALKAKTLGALICPKRFLCAKYSYLVFSILPELSTTPFKLPNLHYPFGSVVRMQLFPCPPQNIERGRRSGQWHPSLNDARCPLHPDKYFLLLRQ